MEQALSREYWATVFVKLYTGTNFINECNSDLFLVSVWHVYPSISAAMADGWLPIDQGDGTKYHHAQANYFEEPGLRDPFSFKPNYIYIPPTGDEPFVELELGLEVQLGSYRLATDEEKANFTFG